MFLIQLLLPLTDNHGGAIDPAEYAHVRAVMVEQFGGVTAYTRSPAEGLWEDENKDLSKDEIVVVEVMAPGVDRAWWRSFRKDLQKRFRQQEIVIRAQEMTRL